MSAALATPVRPTPTTATRERTSTLALLGWMGFVILVVWTIFVGGAAHGPFLVQLRIASLALIALVLGGWFVASLRLASWRPATAIWPTLAIPIAVLILGTLTSRMPRLGIEYVAWAILLVGLYLFLVRLLSTRFARDRIGGLAAMLALVLGLTYMATVLARWVEWWGLVGHLEIPPLRPLYAGLVFGNPNAVLTMQLLLTAVAFGGLGVATRGRRLTIGALVVITIVVGIMTGGRAGWVASAGAIVIVGGAALLMALRRGRLGKDGQLGTLARRRSVRLGVVSVFVLAIVAALVAAPAIAQRLSGGDGGRTSYYTSSLRMFADAPLLGSGVGTWPVQRAAYTHPGEVDWYISHAHNVYLQTLAELGLVGIATGILAAVPVAWLVLRGLRAAAAPETRRWAWMAAFGFTYLAIHGLFDYYLNMPAVMFAAAVPVAVLDATSSRRLGLGSWTTGLGGRAPVLLGRAARGLFWVGCLVAVLLLARVESVALTHQAAVMATDTGKWVDAEPPAREAVAADPDMPAHQMTLGLVAAARHDWTTAAAAYERAAAADDIPMSWLGLAQALIELDAPPDQASEALERALRIGAAQPAVAYAAAHLYDRLGLTDEATELYATALAALPSLATDPTWTADAALTTRWPTILARAEELAPGSAWELALMAGEPDRARTLASATPGLPDWTAQVIEAWQGDPAARAEVEARADADPDDARALAWATRLAARADDLDAADHYGQLLAYATIEGATVPGQEVRVEPSRWLKATPAGTVTWYAGQWLYRRPTTADLIPPGLPRLVYVDPLADEPGADTPPERG